MLSVCVLQFHPGLFFFFFLMSLQKGSLQKTTLTERGPCVHSRREGTLYLPCATHCDQGFDPDDFV